MNVLADPFKQLVERKLWPIALLLVAALVAVPVLLAKDAAPSEPLPVATTLPSGGAAAETASVVTLSDAGKRDRLRAVLGSRKDPFRPAQIHHVKKQTDGLTTDGVQTSVDTGVGGTSGDSGGATTLPGADLPSVTAVPTAEPKTYELYSLKVRFGDTAGDQLVTREVKRLTGLPGGTHPAVLYLGLTDDHKSAVFTVDAGVEVLGDGDCQPTPENCQTLTLKKGETVFLTRGAKQWELDLVGINAKKTTDSDAASKAKKETAEHGHDNLVEFGARAANWHYDAGSGTLKKVSRAKTASHSAIATFSTSG